MGRDQCSIHITYWAVLCVCVWQRERESEREVENENCVIEVRRDRGEGIFLWKNTKFCVCRLALSPSTKRVRGAALLEVDEHLCDQVRRGSNLKTPLFKAFVDGFHAKSKHHLRKGEGQHLPHPCSRCLGLYTPLIKSLWSLANFMNYPIPSLFSFFFFFSPLSVSAIWAI